MTGWRRNGNDSNNEKRCAEYLSARWSCLFHPFAHGSPIDWWLERDHKVTGIAELKTSLTLRDYAILNLRKYTRLATIAEAFEVPAIYINQQPDGSIYWTNIAEVTASTCIVGSKIYTSNNDREPALRIELANMRKA